MVSLHFSIITTWWLMVCIRLLLCINKWISTSLCRPILSTWHWRYSRQSKYCQQCCHRRRCKAFHWASTLRRLHRLVEWELEDMQLPKLPRAKRLRQCVRQPWEILFFNRTTTYDSLPACRPRLRGMHACRRSMLWVCRCCPSIYGHARCTDVS